ncbi:MAG: hypothetical protein IJM30_05530 [Thermoguttaceae bacterium]|nr:hypothetical protein [Thermoguttaceae bacterium]
MTVDPNDKIFSFVEERPEISSALVVASSQKTPQRFNRANPIPCSIILSFFNGKRKINVLFLKNDEWKTIQEIQGDKKRAFVFGEELFEKEISEESEENIKKSVDFSGGETRIVASGVSP